MAFTRYKASKSDCPWLWHFMVECDDVIGLSMLFPIDTYSNHIPSQTVLTLMAARNVFSYLLSLGQSYVKSKMHQMTPKWPWMLPSQSYTIYVDYCLRDPNFSPFHSTIVRFPDNLVLFHRVQWWIWNFRKKKSLKIGNSTFQKSPNEFG